MPVVARCNHCSTERRLTDADMLLRLQAKGMLKRETDPRPDLMRELLTTMADQLTCQDCREAGLTIQDDWDDDWEDEVRCEGCKAIIPAERLEIFPDTKFCPSCKSKSEAGEEPGAEAEYCQRCGGLMKLTKRRGSGIAGYAMTCSECGKRG